QIVVFHPCFTSRHDSPRYIPFIMLNSERLRSIPMRPQLGNLVKSTNCSAGLYSFFQSTSLLSTAENISVVMMIGTMLRMTERMPAHSYRTRLYSRKTIRFRAFTTVFDRFSFSFMSRLRASSTLALSVAPVISPILRKTSSSELFDSPKLLS
ncbi:hypothetical protein PFISCL1PPCAC_10956, partial [Pristionchus fissidentatus]